MAHRHAWVAIVGAAVLAGCAPVPGPGRSGERSEDVLRTTGSFDMSMQLNRADAVIADTVAVDPARAWNELPAVYQALGLPVSEADPAGRRLAVAAFQPRRIEGQALSRFLDCGRGNTTGPNADSYQVFLWVETRVVSGPAGRGTLLSKISANARPRAMSGNPVPCTSRGVLERRISELLRQRLGAAGG